MRSIGGAFTSADSPPSIRRLSCRSAWPISRFSVTVASRPPARIAVSTADITVQSCLTWSVTAARSRPRLTRSSSSKWRSTSLPLIQPSSAVWNAGRRRCAAFSKPRAISGCGRPARTSRWRSNGPALSSTSVPSDSDGLSRAWRSSFSSGNKTSATSLPPPSTRSRYAGSCTIARVSASRACSPFS